MAYLVGRNKISDKNERRRNRRARERKPSWAKNVMERERDGRKVSLLIARLTESRQDGGHLKVFSTAINNPERMSFHELTRSERGGGIEVRRDSSFFEPLSGPSPSSFSLSPLFHAPFGFSLRRAISTWKCPLSGACGPRKYLHDLFRGSEK